MDASSYWSKVSLFKVLAYNMVPLGKVKVFSSMTSNSKNFEMLYRIEKQMTGMTKVLVE